jgi:hypothetical protein
MPTLIHDAILFSREGTRTLALAAPLPFTLHEYIPLTNVQRHLLLMIEMVNSPLPASMYDPTCRKYRLSLVDGQPVYFEDDRAR